MLPHLDSRAPPPPRAWAETVEAPPCTSRIPARFLSVPLREGSDPTSSFIFSAAQICPDLRSWSLRQPRPAPPPRLGECHDSSFWVLFLVVWGGRGHLHEPPITLATALRHSLMRRHHNHSALVVSPSSLTVSLHSTLLAPRTLNLSMGS